MQQHAENLASSVPNHIGLVVKDADKTAEFFTITWGFGPWSSFEYSTQKDDMIVGDPFSLKIVYAKLGPTAVELLQPLDKGSIWYKFLETNGEGLHHLAFTVENYDEMVSKLKRRGAKMVVSGRTPAQFNRRPWCYFDTKPGGLIIEYMDGYGL